MMSACKNCIKVDVCKYNDGHNLWCKGDCPKYIQALLPCVDVIPKVKPNIKDKKRNWENGFQKWSNKQAQDGTNSFGVCGYGSMCDYCEDNTYGRPCVRALNKMCREKWLYIDYSKMTYEEVWSGVSL